MLVDASALTGYSRQDCQIRWLNEHGFKHGRNWWQQRKNGKIVVNLAESTTLEPVVKLNLSALGPEKTNTKAPAAKAVHEARQLPAKAS